MGEAIDTGRIREIASELAALPGALLPVLHALQAEYRHVPAEAIPVVAEVLNLSRAEVHGALSFYHLLRKEPPGERVLYICRAEACQAVGGADLERYALDRLGIDFHETTADGAVTLEPVYCLGNCACSPAVMIDETLHGRVTPDRLDELLGS